jgi:uncharacterized protein YecT (DUF1311 family)
MWTRAIVIVLAIVALAGAASAQGQGDLNDQAGREFKAAEHRLEAVVNQLDRQASPNGRARLKIAQAAWQTFRKADCDARTGSRGGSVYPMVYAYCMAADTDDRTKQLKHDLRCRQEDDLGCGAHRED